MDKSYLAAWLASNPYFGRDGLALGLQIPDYLLDVAHGLLAQVHALLDPVRVRRDCSRVGVLGFADGDVGGAQTDALVVVRDVVSE